MQEKIVYGKKHGPFDGQFVTVFFDDEDNHIGVTWTSDKQSVVYHFILKEGYTFDYVANELENALSNCVDMDDTNDELQAFFGDDGAKYLEDYPEYVQEMRTEEEICTYMDEAFDKVWLMRTHPVKNHPDIEKRRLEAIERILNTYDDIPEEGFTDWECGYWNGILGALRWVLGDEKDFLDT